MINLINDYYKKQNIILKMTRKQMGRMKNKLYKLYRLPYIHGEDIFVPDCFEMNERYLNNQMDKGKMTIKDWRTLRWFNWAAYCNN